METTVSLDVRPFHARGEEPFAAIMEAVDGLADDQSLVLINSFEPAPLYAVMQRRGFTHCCEQVASEEYRITFSRA